MIASDAGGRRAITAAPICLLEDMGLFAGWRTRSTEVTDAVMFAIFYAKARFGTVFTSAARHPRKQAGVRAVPTFTIGKGKYRVRR